MHQIQIICIIIVLVLQLAILFEFIQPSPITFYLTSILLTFALGMEKCHDKVSGGMDMPEYFKLGLLKPGFLRSVISMPEFLKSPERKEHELYLNTVEKLYSIGFRTTNLTKEFILSNINIIDKNYNIITGLNNRIIKTFTLDNVNLSPRITNCIKDTLNNVNWMDLSSVQKVCNDLVKAFDIYCLDPKYKYTYEYTNDQLLSMFRDDYLDFCNLYKNLDKYNDILYESFTKFSSPTKERLPILANVDNTIFVNNYYLYDKLSKLPSHLFEEPSILNDINDINMVNKIIAQYPILKDQKNHYNRHPDFIIKVYATFVHLMTKYLSNQNEVVIDLSLDAIINNKDVYKKYFNVLNLDVPSFWENLR